MPALDKLLKKKILSVKKNNLYILSEDKAIIQKKRGSVERKYFKTWHVR